MRYSTCDMSRVLGPEHSRRVPWKNGRGSTQELATDAPPGGDWSWRLSIADLPERARFSEYPGIDRLLLCLEGPGLRLWRSGAAQEVPRAGEAVSFPGEEAVEGEPLGPGVRDIGLMVRRERWRGEMRLVRGRPIDAKGAIVLVHVPAAACAARVRAEGGVVEIPPGGTLIAAGAVSSEATDAAVVCALVPWNLQV
jgi:environmental stress-induced protein Ves